MANKQTGNAGKQASEENVHDVFAEAGISVDDIGLPFLDITSKWLAIELRAVRPPSEPEKVNPKTGEKMTLYVEADVMQLDNGQEAQWDITSKRLARDLRNFCLGKQLPLQLRVKATGGKGFGRVYHLEPWSVIMGHDDQGEVDLPCDAPTCGLGYGHEGQHRTSKWLRENTGGPRATVLA